MKILIDLDDLQKKGLVSPDTAATLLRHAVRETGGTAINAFLALGAIAVAAGLAALFQSPGFIAALGAGFVWLGWLIGKQYGDQWGKLASIWMVVGALSFTGGAGALIGNPFAASIIAAAVLIGVSALAESRFLIALAPLALASMLGSSTGYWHACYGLMVEEPTITIVFFTLIGLGGWEFAKRQKGLTQDLSVVFTRMCVVLVNFGFWVGSLWGDTPGHLWRDPMAMIHHPAEQAVSEIVFVIGWALALLAAGAWGARNGSRFMVNTAAVFGGIHFYTQWFERLGGTPVSVILAGLFAIAFGLGLWRYNRSVLA